VLPLQYAYYCVWRRKLFMKNSYYPLIIILLSSLSATSLHFPYTRYNTQVPSYTSRLRSRIICNRPERQRAAIWPKCARVTRDGLCVVGLRSRCCRRSGRCSRNRNRYLGGARRMWRCFVYVRVDHLNPNERENNKNTYIYYNLQRKREKETDRCAS